MATPFQLRYAASIIHRGGVIAYPTEAVFGFGCDPLNQDAVAKILSIKQRDWRKGLILIASDFDQIVPYVKPLDSELQLKVEATWPGAVTWLLPAKEDVPAWIKGDHQTIAVRVTAHPVTAALCKTVGMAIISTSANRANQPPIRKKQAIEKWFGDCIDYIVPGKLGDEEKPSKIINGATGKIIR